MRSGRMARRLVATAGMGAIIAMGVLSACAKEQKAPEPTTPNTPSRLAAAGHACSAAAGAGSGGSQPTRQQVEHVRACSHVPWRQLTPDWSIRSRSGPPSPQCCAGGREGRHMADSHVQRRLHEPRVAPRLR